MWLPTCTLAKATSPLMFSTACLRQQRRLISSTPSRLAAVPTVNDLANRDTDSTIRSHGSRKRVAVSMSKNTHTGYAAKQPISGPLASARLMQSYRKSAHSVVPSPMPPNRSGVHASPPTHGRHTTSQEEQSSASPSSDVAVGLSLANVLTSVVARRGRYQSFEQLLYRYIDHGFSDVDALLHHSEAPSPATVLELVLRYRTPCPRLTERALATARNSHLRSNMHSSASAYSIQYVARVLRTVCPSLYSIPSIRTLLVECLLREGLFSESVAVLEGMPDTWMTSSLWMALVEAAGQSKVPDSQLLWRLLGNGKTSETAVLTRAGESTLLTASHDSCCPAPSAVLRMPPVPLSPFDVRSTAVVLASVSVSPSPIRESDLQHSPSDREAAAQVPQGKGNDNALATSATPSLHWCVLNPAEIRYALEHYSGNTGAAGDERRFGGRSIYLYDSLEAYFAAQASATTPTGGSNDGDANARKLTVAGLQMTTHGVTFGLDAKTASQLLLRAGVSFGGQASPLLALQIMERYVRSCHILRSETDILHDSIEKQLRSRQQWVAGPLAGSHKGEHRIALAKKPHAVSQHVGNLHPSPFLLFFKVFRDARDVLARPEAFAGEDAVGGTSVLPMMHWGMVWRYFQLLNREHPFWFTVIPRDAGELCMHVIEVLCRGADPWLCLNVARWASARHIIDGLEVSFWLLRRLDPSHHTTETKEVARKLFRWLLMDVGVHLQPQLHHQLASAARILIRLDFQEELKTLYNAVLDNVYSFSSTFREEFMRIMEDLICPVCSSVLRERNVYIARTCTNCLAVISARDPHSIPSFRLSAEHVRRIAERRRQKSRRSRERIHENIQQLSTGSAVPFNAQGGHRAYPEPYDAARVLKRYVLSETSALLPGVRVSSECVLFPMKGDDNESRGGRVPLDIRTAMEVSNQRLELQQAARQYALDQRGVDLGETRPALPSFITMADVSGAPSLSTGWQTSPTSSASVSSSTATLSLEGQWACVWCQETNSEWSNRVQCSACGAETGPAAPWRQFAYVKDGDAMGEIRARIANANERPVDAVVAAYMLMVYRRAFLLRATPHDHERVDHLIRRLCNLHERVLAGYVYLRVVSPPTRRKDHTLLLLAQLFGGVEGYHALREEEVRNDDTLFPAIFTSATCKVCFGTHDWKRCPIITRDFSAAGRPSINLSPEEKQRAILGHLQRLVHTALQNGGSNAKPVVDAYAAFVSSPFRELFGEVYAAETNQLSILLSQFRQYRRAAFVLCHIPLPARWNESYLKLVNYFNVTTDEAMELLAKRSSGDVQDSSHPNFVQVTVTCCMCLDEQHASYMCPRLMKWLSDVQDMQSKFMTRASLQSRRPALLDTTKEAEVTKRYLAQVDGWISAGPERLHAFYRFLLEHMDVVRPGSSVGAWDNQSQESGAQMDGNNSLGSAAPCIPSWDLNEPFIYAVNKTITKLATVGQRSNAYRLYAHAPVKFVSMATTTAMLQMNQFSEANIRAMLNTDMSMSVDTSSPLAGMLHSSEAARTAAVPMRSHCLLCFDSGHAFFSCPELIAQTTVVGKLQTVVQHVGSLCSTPDGVSAAAAYVYHIYNKGHLTQELLRANPELVRGLLTLCHRCFATKQLGPGVRVLRRIPTEMVSPDPIYVELWRAAGLAEDVVESRRAELLALYDTEGLVPSITNPPPRRTYSARFMSNLGHTLHDDLCRHCYQHGHTLATCQVFHAEVSFGRDYVAAYRMSMMSEQLDRDWQDGYLMQLVDFFRTHQYFMPYHIAGVANAVNAISAMWSFRGEPGIALQQLLWIPPAYRRRQAFKHILHCVQVPATDIARVLENYYFVPDDLGSSHGVEGGGIARTGVVAQHLLMPKPAIRDVAMKTVFEHFPNALRALEESAQRMASIRNRNRHTDAKRPQQSDLSSPGDMRCMQTSMRVMQSGDITQLREDFDPILSELEDAVGMKLGSRHILFTSAVDVISAASSTAHSSADDVSVVKEETQGPSVVTEVQPNDLRKVKKGKAHTDQRRRGGPKWGPRGRGRGAV